MENALVQTEKMTADDAAPVVRHDGGLSAWSPDELRTMVAQEIELRTIVVDYYRSQMTPNHHYYTLQEGQKPALGKEGALNLCSLFKVRVSAEDPHEVYNDDGHYTVRYRVHLVSMRSGEVVADGEASCSTRESKYAYRWIKERDLPDSLDTTTLAKRSNQWGTQYRVPHPDLADHYNTVLKMAFKRAIVAAALCLPLVSELFTQDFEEEHLRSAASSNGQGARSGEANPPSDRQRLFLLSLLEEAGHRSVDAEQIVDGLSSRSEASAMIEELRAAGKKKPETRRTGLQAAWEADKQQWVDAQGEPINVTPPPDDDDWQAEASFQSEYDKANQVDPMTDKQRMKLLGMLKQLGVRDGDKRELVGLLNLDKTRASALIDKITTDGAEQFPWQVLSVYVSMLRDRTGKTNKNIKDFCQSTYGVAGAARLDSAGRRALFDWLAAFAGEPEEEPIDEMAEWIEAAGITSEQLSRMSNEDIQADIQSWKELQAHKQEQWEDKL